MRHLRTAPWKHCQVKTLASYFFVGVTLMYCFRSG